MLAPHEEGTTVLINSQRFYERIQLGLASPDEDVRDCAETCMSYLATVLREPQIVLPDEVVARMLKLPDGE